MTIGDFRIHSFTLANRCLGFLSRFVAGRNSKSKAEHLHAKQNSRQEKCFTFRQNANEELGDLI